MSDELHFVDQTYSSESVFASVLLRCLLLPDALCLSFMLLYCTGVISRSMHNSDNTGKDAKDHNYRMTSRDQITVVLLLSFASTVLFFF